MLLDKMFGTFLCINFKEDSIVLSCLKNSFSGITLVSSSTFSLSDDETVFEEIKRYVGDHPDISRVFVSVPDKWAISKFVEVPAMKGRSPGSLVNLMKFEVERHVPYEVDDVAYDFMVIQEKEKTSSVVFVAIKNERIEFVKEFLEKASLSPDTVTISSLAVLNTIELSGVNTGGWQEVVGIVRRPRIWGGGSDANISLHIDRMRAAIATIRGGCCIGLKAFDFFMEDPVDEFLEKIIKYIIEMQSIHRIDSFRKIILTGNMPSMPSLKQSLEGKIKENGITVSEVVIFSGEIRGTEVNGLAPSIGAAFAGLGIGTYAINLLPHKKEYAAKKVAPQATKVFLVTIAVLIVSIFASEVIKKRNMLTMIERTLDENKPAIREIEELTSELKVLEEKRRFLKNMTESEMTLELLAELSNVLPTDAWITNLIYKKDMSTKKRRTGEELVISGYAVSSSNLIPLLEESLFFEKVEFVGPIKKTRNKEQFKLSAKVVAP